MRQRFEYAVAWLVIKTLGALPRPLARAAAISLSRVVYLLHLRLRRVGMRNLARDGRTIAEARAGLERELVVRALATSGEERGVLGRPRSRNMERVPP